jgi:PPOX class probable F420-dependent enzyme
MSVTFTEETRRLLDGKNFATVATLGKDGAPQTSVTWLLRDGDTVLVSVTSRRQKARNLARDPRIGISVFDLANPYHSVDIRGTAELIEDPDKELPRRLSHKYLGQDPPAESADEQRLIIKVTPSKVTGFSI